MSTVYVVVEEDQDYGNTFAGAFTTREGADASAASLGTNGYGRLRYEVVEVALDPALRLCGLGCGEAAAATFHWPDGRATDECVPHAAATLREHQGIEWEQVGTGVPGYGRCPQ